MGLQSAKYYHPAAPPAPAGSTLPEFDFSARTWIPSNAMFALCYASAATSEDNFAALMKLRKPLKWAKYSVQTPLISVLYVTKEQSGYGTYTFSPTVSNFDLALQTCLSATRKLPKWDIPVSILQGTVTTAILNQGVVDWMATGGAPSKILFTGHSLGGACAILAARATTQLYEDGTNVMTSGALKISNGVEKTYVRSIDFHTVNDGDPVPDFPPPLFASANPDFGTNPNAGPMEMSKYSWNSTRVVLSSTGKASFPDDASQPRAIDGAWPTIKLATKLNFWKQHLPAEYIARMQKAFSATAFDSMVAAAGF